MNRFYKLAKAYKKWEDLTPDQRSKLCEGLRKYHRFNVYYLAILTIITIPFLYKHLLSHSGSTNGLMLAGIVLLIIGYIMLIFRTLWTHNAYQYASQNLNKADDSQQTSETDS